MTKPTDTNSSPKKHKKADVSSNKTVKTKPEAMPKPPISSSGNKTSTFSLLNIAGISATLVLGCYNIIQLKTVSSNLQQAQNQNSTQQKSLIAQLQTQLDSQEQAQAANLSTMKEAYSQQISVLEHSIKELNNNKAGNDQTWKLQKTAYLLSMAQLTLHWEKKPNAAIELLSSADNLVKSLNSPQFIGLRHSISNEIVSLKSLPKIDTMGLLTQLNALSHQINNLPLKKPTTQQAPAESTLANVSTSPTSPAWKKALNASIETLSKLIVIRKHHQTYTPLLSQEGKSLVVRQVQLGFKQAEWAVLNQSIEPYLFSLEKIQKALQTYFDTTSASTQSTLAMVDNLMKENISLKLPNVERSYQQVMDIIKSTTTTKGKGDRE